MVAPTVLSTKKTNSNGTVGGALSGQAMAMGLNLFISGLTVTGFDPFPAGLGDIKYPATGNLLCTQHGTTCAAFSFPSCVNDQTVDAVYAAANHFLGDASSGLGCTASEFTEALDAVNEGFDGCATLIPCKADNGSDPDIDVTIPGPFACPVP